MLNVRRQQGSSLLEVLIAALLLGTAMLAMAWQHAAALKYDKMSQFRGVATQLGGDLADRIRANAGAAASYQRAVVYAPQSLSSAAVNCRLATCSAQNMADFDLAEFRNAARTMLPDGDLHVTLDGASQLTIWVLWRDPETIDNAAKSASLAAYCPSVAVAGVPDPLPQCLPLKLLL